MHLHYFTLMSLPIMHFFSCVTARVMDFFSCDTARVMDFPPCGGHRPVGRQRAAEPPLNYFSFCSRVFSRYSLRIIFAAIMSTYS